ncbi:MAG: hypothetical protein CBC13_02880 [Planctomycetia bacterium TMED53]|nr:MAG: hypothetical protein CBC13_02880 [Planctomycetia bacterium TMED53]
MARRVLLKVSGEALGGSAGIGICQNSLARITQQVARASSHVEIAIVVGAGNICRGQDWSATDLPQPLADSIGMAATHVNGLSIHAHLRLLGVQSVVMGAGSPVPQVAAFDSLIGRNELENGKVVILTGGTGNPFFTTDTCSALRAAELDCSEILKATKVDGVYENDPVENPNAKLFDQLTFEEALRLKIRVMDSTAFTMCNEQDIAVRVFNIAAEAAIEKALLGEPVGTLVFSD